MGNYYADPAGSNTSPYDTWAKAAPNIQTVLDLATTTDVIYCRGSQTTTATIDVDTQTGAQATGFIKVIGCNSSGNVDGTRFVLNANGGTYSVVTIAAACSMYWWENIEVKNTAAGTYHGFTGVGAGGTGHVFINCCANTCGAVGFNTNSNIDRAIHIRGIAYSNGTNGFVNLNGRSFFCASRDNSLDGFNGTGQIHFGCIAYDNTDDGFDSLNQYSTLINCISNGNGDNGIEVYAYTGLWSPVFLGCRVTNHSGAGDIGVNAITRAVITGYCYFEDNDGDNIQNNSLGQVIPLQNSSSSSNLQDQANTNEGYTDLTNDAQDFNLRSDASLRRTAITIPVL